MQDGIPNPPAGDQPAPASKKAKMPVWARLLVGLAGIIAIISGLYQIFGGPGGHDVPYGKDIVTYYHDATRADADALAKALKDAGYFGSNPDGVTVLLDKKADAITLSFVVKPEKADDPDTKKVFHDLAIAVAKSVSGNLTAIKLVDPELHEKQSLDVGPVNPPAANSDVSKPVTASFAGSFSDGKVTVELSESGGAYVGTIAQGDTKFPAKASVAGQGLAGTFTSNGNEYAFTATLDGDRLIFTTGGKTYTLARATAQPRAAPTQPHAAPTGAAPQSGGAQFGNFSVLGSTPKGQTLFMKLPAGQTLEAAIIQTADELGKVFDGKPELTGAFANAQGRNNGGATLNAKLKGQDIQGLIFCGTGPNGGSATAIIAALGASKDEVAMLMGFMPVPLKMTTHTFPDGSGSVDLPDGWTTNTQSASNGIFVKGPAGQTVIWCAIQEIYDPDCRNERMRRQIYNMQMSRYQRDLQNYNHMVEVHRQNPNILAPGDPPQPPPPYEPDPNINSIKQHLPLRYCKYCDGVEDLIKVFTPVIASANQRAGLPYNSIDKVIVELPGKPDPNNPNANSGTVYIVTTVHDGETATHYRQLNTVWTGNTVPGEVWQLTGCYMQAPDATFDKDLPKMSAVMASVKVDMTVVGKETAAAGEATREQGREQFAAMQRNHAAWQDQQAQQFADHEQQIAAQEKATHDSSSDFIEYVRGVRDVYDTQTGQMGSVDLFNANGIVNGMNNAANDPNRFVQIPLRYER